MVSGHVDRIKAEQKTMTQLTVEAFSLKIHLLGVGGLNEPCVIHLCWMYTLLRHVDE